MSKAAPATITPGYAPTGRGLSCQTIREYFDYPERVIATGRALSTRSGRLSDGVFHAGTGDSLIRKGFRLPAAKPR